MLVNQQIATTGLLDLLYYDQTIMDGFVTPEGIDRQLALDTIYHKNGLTPLYHPDPEYMKYYVPVWCQKNMKTWEDLYKTTIQNYNPIHNYDRTEEVTDTRDSTRNETKESTRDETRGVTENSTSNTKQSEDSSVTDSSKETREHTISADNSDDYEPGHQDDSNREDTQNSESSSKVDVSGNRKLNETTGEKAGEKTGETTGETYKHSLRAYGNIGVTTTQKMLESERKLVRYNVYDEIADSFKKEFCLYLY